MTASDPLTPASFNVNPNVKLGANWSIEHVQVDQRRPALALLLTGRPSGADMAVDHFLDFIRSRGMSLERFWVAYELDKPQAAVLLVEAPGKAGMLFLSPMTQDRQITPIAALIAHASLAEHTRGLSLLQILIDPHQKREQQASEQGGFSVLAYLQYMRRRTHKPVGQLPLNDDMQVSQWDESRRKLFGDAILASYQGTLDCPGLLGMRKIDDIIAGHMGAGTFTPSLWQVVHRGDEPCAVMLMNQLSSGDAMELAYLGIAPAQRGRGLGGRLLTHGLGLACEAGMREMLLAVDEDNAPALGLYRAHKFSATARKVAMLRAVIK